MKIQVLQENLSKALSITSHFSSSKVQLPVLANILFKSHKNKLLIIATNLEMSISLSLGAKIDEEGDITIPTRTTTDLINNLKPGQLEIITEKEKMEISAQGFKSSISGMDSSDFPSVPTSLDVVDFKINPVSFQNALYKVLFSVSVDETRPVLTGVLIILQKEGMVLVSTDGFRLSQVKIKAPEIKKELKVILPKNALQELVRLMGENEIEFSYSKTDNQVLFGVENAVLTSRVIDGEFPDFERIIPKKTTITLITDREELLRAVKLASVFARDSANVVKLDIEKDGIDVLAESAQHGSQRTSVDAKFVGGSESVKDFVIGFNYRFLEDFLTNVEGDDIQIGLSDPNSPATFLDLKERDYLHIIMPVRMQT